jgi:hypothetical protein
MGKQEAVYRHSGFVRVTHWVNALVLLVLLMSGLQIFNAHPAFHPQTILAYEMNGVPLPVAHGAPLRVRVERQLGYKMAKYVMRIEAVPDIRGVRGGRGGFWEDLGYEWYAGI